LANRSIATGFVFSRWNPPRFPVDDEPSGGSEPRRDEYALSPEYLAFMEAAPDAIVIVGAGGKIVAVNGLAVAMFDYPRSRLIGSEIEILVPQRYHSVHHEERDTYARAPRTRPMGAGRQLTGRRSDGVEFPVEISLSPLVIGDRRLVVSIVRDITDRRRAEQIIEASLREKEALLKEIHHRVKNNLQVTSSLLRLQAALIVDPATREMFDETQGRIRSMALVHEKLYQASDLSRIDFGEYVRTLAGLLFRSMMVDPTAVQLEVEGGPIYFSIDVAIPCGLITNELLSNSLKHGFPAGRRGKVVVTLKESPEGLVTLDICDDGVGLADGVQAGRSDTLGLQIVKSLASQLDGTFELEQAGGTRARVTFPGNGRTGVVHG
jgi:PAS domain S-box-containing protein